MSILRSILSPLHCHGDAGYKLDIGIGTAVAVGLQFTIAVPFLLQQPTSYFIKAFEFSRTFLYQWSVNWRFVPKSTFLSGSFAGALLGAHLGLLLLFSHCKWCRSAGGLQGSLCTVYNTIPLGHLLLNIW